VALSRTKRLGPAASSGSGLVERKISEEEIPVSGSRKKKKTPQSFGGIRSQGEFWGPREGLIGTRQGEKKTGSGSSRKLRQRILNEADQEIIKGEGRLRKLEKLSFPDSIPIQRSMVRAGR